MHLEKYLKAWENIIHDIIVSMNVVGDMFSSPPTIKYLKQKVAERDIIIAEINEESWKV